ncbi:hypothetical protein GCM10010191_75840 [Actinomadura vinacea]|uniref:Uncharacterized protein n=1 Tax=Actinomadura vinacea TaxID=115336 RepID=A0ABN3K3K9_9ACTN
MTINDLRGVLKVKRPGFDRGSRLWLAPHRIKQTIADLHEAQENEPVNSLTVRARARIARCDTKLARYRAALESGTDPATVARWVTEVNAERSAAEAELRTAESQQHELLTPEEIEELITRLGGLVRILAKAEPETRQDVYQQLGVRLTYHPDKQEIRAEVNLDPDRIRQTTTDRHFGVTVSVRGATGAVSPKTIPLSAALPFSA